MTKRIFLGSTLAMTQTSTNSELEVILAHSAGTCFGVQAAIDIAEDVHKPILGPLVHNPKIVGDLANKGIPIHNRYTEFENLKDDGVSEVVITAHGYPKELKEKLTELGITYHDATCPVLLKWVYGKIKTFEKDGYNIILVGNPKHAEIIASRSYGTNIHVVYSEEEINNLPDNLDTVVAICQTTITREKFQHLVDSIRNTKYPDLKAVDTRCKPVKNQQAAVEMLAQWVDAMIIIGGFNSSNTTNLHRISSQFLPEKSYHIDNPDMIKPEWLKNVKHLGIGAGTSTPVEQIKEVQKRILDMYPGEVVFRKENRDGEVLDADFTPEDEI